MKIKTQSFILMAGIVAMPLLVASLFFIVERISSAARDASRYEGLELRSSTMSDDELVRSLFSEKPDSLRMAVADPSGVVVYSDLAGVPAGSIYEISVMDAARKLERGKVLAFGFAPPMPEGYQAIASVPRIDLLPLRMRDDIIKVGMLILAAILAFAATMSIQIVKSIAKSVLSLEAATKRVAAGEFDLPIDVEGSNEIASLSRSLDMLRVEIKENRARRARFVMGISHDLKTPLALVKGYAEALEEELGDSGPGAAAHLGIIQAKADQLEGMIDDLIDFERVDTGEWSRGLSDVDLGAFLRAFAKRIEADAAILGRELRGNIDLPEAASVRIDERLVTRALENLVNNALRYTPEGGKIELSARAEGGRLIVSVSDDGPGIPPEDIPRIFEPFFRGSSSRREQGMGLGLSIVKTVVESHGWTIEALPGHDSSGAARGVTFILSIPRSERPSPSQSGG
jgi:signal transduction histidine kinase